LELSYFTYFSYILGADGERIELNAGELQNVPVRSSLLNFKNLILTWTYTTGNEYSWDHIWTSVLKKLCRENSKP